MTDLHDALIMIDMQNGFIEPESCLCIAGAKRTVPECARVLHACREKSVPVIFVTRVYRGDGSDVELTRRDRWLGGGKPLSPEATGPLSAQMPACFGESPSDYHLVKPRFSAFFQTPLDLLLRRLRVDRVVLAGTTTPNCIRTTCYDALSLDYAVTVLADCCSSATEEIQAANLRDMANIGAQIVSAADYLRA